MPEFNRNDTRTPHHLKQRAERLRDQANNELDERRRQQMRNLAAHLERQAREASRPRG
jgi:predicted nucleic acid-binding protein